MSKGLVLVLLLAAVALGLWLRMLDFSDPWSGAINDFRSYFGGFATGGPARNFVEWGFWESRLMPYYWRIELADGSVQHAYYAHHPALFAVLPGALMAVFGVHEWVVRLPWVVLSTLALFATYRLVRLLYGERLALVATFFQAVIPFAAFFGSMAWTEDSAVIWIYALLLRRYVLWLRGGGNRHLAIGAAYAFLGGLFEWMAGLIYPGLCLHALWVSRARRDWKPFLASCALSCGMALAVAVHFVHMRLVVPSEHASADTSKTLAWVTTMADPLPEFLAKQWSYLDRFLTTPVLLVVAAMGLVWLVLAARRKLSLEDGLLFVMALPGVLYVFCFPGRSDNHYFFPGLSTLYFATASALLTCGLARWARNPDPEARSKRLFAGVALCALALRTSWLAYGHKMTQDVLLARERPLPEGADLLLVVPLIVALAAGPLTVLGFVVAGARRSTSGAATAAFLGALLAVGGWCSWRNVDMWSQRPSRPDSIAFQELLQEEWLQELIGDPKTVILAPSGSWMPIQFHSRAAIVHSVNTVERDPGSLNPGLLEHRAQTLSKAREDLRIVFLMEVASPDPVVQERITRLSEYLLQVSTPEVHGRFVLFDLTEWARESA